MSEDVVTPAHGAGAGRTRELIDRLVAGFEAPEYGPDALLGLAARDDGAVLPGGEGEVVVTTDSHVVDPPTFPGGDLGTLAVAGTVNDLAVMGATDPLGITVGLVVEAGTPIEALEGVVESMRETCERAGCPVVAGDTKVMGSGEVDGVVVNTTGVGRVQPGEYVAGDPRPGDAVVVSGTVGDHGIALLAEREGFDFESPIESDVTPVTDPAAAALEAGTVTAMTDPTRGGFATALHELLDGCGMVIDAEAVPVDDTVASAGEVLGIDPMQVACEGRLVATVAPGDAEAVVAALREFDIASEAAVVGEVTADHAGRVVLDTGLGQRYLQEPSGRTLPRIC